MSQFTATETHATINRLANLSPTALMSYKLEYFRTAANMMRYEDIISVFKQYQPLDNGNSKLAKGILSFSLLPVVTCQQKCKGCYDVKSLRYRSVRMKRIVNTLLATGTNHTDELFVAILKQIKNSRTVKAVRIHVGGDFFSRDYVLMWQEVSTFTLKVKPEVKFYTYTKTQYRDDLVLARINVVKSKLDDGRYNFGPIAEVKEMAKEFKGIVCPATLKDVPDQYCGTGCRACQTLENVFFVAH